MGFEFISARARALLEEPAGSADGGASSAQLLIADYLRWSRWALGLAAHAAAMIAGFLFVVLLGTIAVVGRAGPVDVLAVLIGGALTAAALWTLLRLRSSGRRVLIVAARRVRPEAHPTGSRGWRRARTINFDPPVFARLCTATMSLLIGIAGISLFFRGLSAGGDPMSTAALVIGIISAAAGIGQVGGVMRLVAMAAERDPVWVRLRGLWRNGA